MNVEHDKRERRAEVRRRRRALTPEERRDAARAACATLCALDEVRAAGSVALYAALPEELDLGPAVETLTGRDVRVLLPRIEDDQIVLVQLSDRGAAPGYRGITEPIGPRAAIDGVDVVVVPGVAFDRAGNRLGQGGGHYDRLLATLPASTVRIGVCFACQLFDEVPHDGHDEPVDAVVTERGVVRAGDRRSTPPTSGRLPPTD